MQHAVSQEAQAFLQAQTDARGRKLQVVKLPVPPPLHITAGEAAGAHSQISFAMSVPSEIVYECHLRCGWNQRFNCPPEILC